MENNLVRISTSCKNLVAPKPHRPSFTNMGSGNNTRAVFMERRCYSERIFQSLKPKKVNLNSYSITTSNFIRILRDQGDFSDNEEEEVELHDIIEAEEELQTILSRASTGGCGEANVSRIPVIRQGCQIIIRPPTRAQNPMVQDQVFETMSSSYSDSSSSSRSHSLLSDQ